METVAIFLASKIIEYSDCSHEIKRRLLLGSKAMTNLDWVKKQRHHFATKACIVNTMFFPVAMYRYMSWTRKKAECPRIDAKNKTGS